MISPHVTAKYAVWFHNVPHYPVGVCMHCGASDDPEGYWAEDKDGDRICRTCKAKENTMGWISTDDFPLTHPRLNNLVEAQGDDEPYVPDEVLARLDAAIDRRQRQTPVEIDRRAA